MKVAALNFARYIWQASGMRDARNRQRFRRKESEWRRVRGALPRADLVRNDDAPIIIIPPDPILLTASKGDEAMIVNSIAAVKGKSPERRIIIATGSDIADAKALSLGVEYCRLEFGKSLADNVATMAMLNAGDVLTIGADVLDGAYDPSFSFELFALTDLLALSGVRPHITGFSVSKAAYANLGPAYAEAHEAIVFRLRDPDSFDRFKLLSNAKCELVADPAFLLVPATDATGVAACIDWVKKRQSSNRVVVGFNIHPILFNYSERKRINEIMSIVSEELKVVLQKVDMDIVLISHDFRGRSADKWCHDPLVSDLESYRDRILNIAEEHPASDLKALVASLDGVITGRMHLAIASLGAGTPVLGLSYKDKFSGLMRHFKFSEICLIENADILKNGMISSSMLRFLNNIPKLRGEISSSLDDVKSLSKKNFDFLN